MQSEEELKAVIDETKKGVEKTGIILSDDELAEVAGGWRNWYVYIHECTVCGTQYTSRSEISYHCQQLSKVLCKKQQV